MTQTALDEMVDGKGGLRPHWRSMLGALVSMGAEDLNARARRLDRAFEEEGITGLLPGAERAVWRCDPVPLPLPGREFDALEMGLAQRARLLQAVLEDVYGPQTLLTSGALPPALIYNNPGFLRAGRVRPAGGAPPLPALHFYAADLLRGPDGVWRVLADRSSGATGIGYAYENRRLLARVVPETFRPVQVEQLRPFFDTWQDALTRLAPAGRHNPTVALLTPGTGNAAWFEHAFLARELSCALVEGGDLTVRGGVLYLKTLHGMQRVDVLLRRVDGAMLDPLELAPHSLLGVPGLMDAVRGGAVRVVNDPGAGVLEAPALAAFLPALAPRLLGEALHLPQVPSLWLGDAQNAATVLADADRWLIRPACDAAHAAEAPARLPPAKRADLLARIAQHPAEFVATAQASPSLAPCATPTGLVPRPFLLRLFLVFDGQRWQAMRGGMARMLDGHELLSGRLPSRGLAKDVWVLGEDRRDIVGPAARPQDRLPIRRSVGALPSRVADNFFWLGRYLERLEWAARLVRATLTRLQRGAVLPRELMELRALSHCLAHGCLVSPEIALGASGAALSQALQHSVRERGAIGALLAQVARLADLLRDHLTADMYATFVHAQRAVADDLRPLGGGGAQHPAMEQLAVAMLSIMRFGATVAGLAAENMVQGGSRLFLDLGRRVERAQSIAADIALVLDPPETLGQAAPLDSGMRLVLELCDSVITYRNRYLAALQPAPVFDLVLADPGNPRGLAFQLAAMRDLLDAVASRDGVSLQAEDAAELSAAASGLLARVLGIASSLSDVADPETAGLPAALRALEADLALLSDAISRHYFAMVPLARAVGAAEVMLGAA